MKILFYLLLFCSWLFALCPGYEIISSDKKALLNDSDQKIVLLHQQPEGGYSSSLPIDYKDFEKSMCQSAQGLILAGYDNNTAMPKPAKKQKLRVSEGINYFKAHRGIDVKKTFLGNQDIALIFVYDKHSQVWAGFSPQTETMRALLDTRVLGLLAIEPGSEFVIVAKNESSLKIHSKTITSTCKEKIKSSKYSYVVHSAQSSSAIKSNPNESIALASRNINHLRRGVYSDSRIALIYPKIKQPKGDVRKYGPAKPKMSIEYDSSYAEKTFYAYEYYSNTCYVGVFPSKLHPPMPTLKKIQ